MNTSIIKITRNDIYDIVDTVQELSSYWKDSTIKMLIALAGELATIKYFNDYLRANPKIKFNTNYTNGCDGGYDFEIANTKIDVKTIGKNAQLNKDHTKTKADVLFFTKHLGKLHFHILGFIPRSRLNNLDLNNLIHPYQIKNIYKDYFLPNPIGTVQKKANKVYEVNQVLRSELVFMFDDLNKIMGEQ